MSDHPRYQLLRPIGEGPLARVYLGHDRQLRTAVAVKVLRDTVLADGPRAAQLLDGAGVWAALAGQGPHLVRVLEIDGPRGWLVLEYLPRSLADLLRAGPLSPDQVRAVLRDALEGLAVLHRHGRLHGAVKPANLLLTPEQRVKLGEAPGIDLAAAEAPTPEGSLKYVAPEMFDATFGPIGPAADLYALGFAALELLAGPRFDDLFPGAAAEPVVGWIRVHAGQERPPSARFVCPAAPADLVRVIDRLLARQVAGRYASAEEALNDLGEPDADVLLAPEAPKRPRRRSRAFLLAAVLLMALLGMGAGLAAAYLRPRHGAMEVTSEPSGARVFIDDAEQDETTPATFARLAAGSHVVRIELPDHDAQEQEVTVVANETAAVAFRLVRSPIEADVHIESTPPGAAVVVDGLPRGPSPVRFKLPEGKYRLRLTLDGHWPIDTELVVPRGHGKVSRTVRLAGKERLTNSIGMALRYIKPGEFQRGSPPGEAGRAANEGPLRKVRISRPFYLGAHEVSQAQYQAVMGVNPSAFTATRGGGPTNPVDGVSYEMAVDFCQKLSALPAEKAAGRVYRLPSEAEWEYAARAGSAAPFAFGGRLNLKQAAFDPTVPYGGAAPADGRSETRSVFAGEPNAWGLVDMHGNVWEWTADWYDKDYYRTAPEADPPGPARGERRVLRGGSFAQPAGLCRSATRHADTPAATSATYGFRVVCEVPAK